jgi:hypothetical protein
MCKLQATCSLTIHWSPELFLVIWLNPIYLSLQNYWLLRSKIFFGGYYGLRCHGTKKNPSLCIWLFFYKWREMAKKHVADLSLMGGLIWWNNSENFKFPMIWNWWGSGTGPMERGLDILFLTFFYCFAGWPKSSNCHDIILCIVSRASAGKREKCVPSVLQ